MTLLQPASVRCPKCISTCHAVTGAKGSVVWACDWCDWAGSSAVLASELEQITETVDNQLVLLEQPPLYNMGVETPTDTIIDEKVPLVALVDWLQVTFPTGSDYETVKLLFGKDWTNLDRGLYGYKQACKREHVTVCWDGNADTVHVQVTGKGCRQLEAEGIVADWMTFLAGLSQWQGAKFTRIDCAVDEKQGLISVDRVEEALKHGHVSSPIQTFERRGSSAVSTGERDKGGTVYLGSPTSDVNIRIYDKAAEQEVEGLWVRVEVQCRRQRAQDMVTLLLKQGASVIGGVIRRYVDIKQPEGVDLSHKYRWKTAEWWDLFLVGCEKINLATAPLQRTIDQVVAWVEAQVAPSLALIEKFYGSRLVTDRIVLNGRKRLTDKHSKIMLASGSVPKLSLPVRC